MIYAINNNINYYLNLTDDPILLFIYTLKVKKSWKIFTISLII